MSELLVDGGEDPWVLKEADSYFYCRNNPEYGAIFVAKASTIAAIGKAALVRVWSGDEANQPLKGIWAPELHKVDEVWHIYFAGIAYEKSQEGADALPDDQEESSPTHDDNKDHRMYVLRALTDDPQGPYGLVGQISTEDDHWAIDGTIAVINDRRYFVWSGWEGEENVRQDIYIAEMDSPTTLLGPRVCISRPEYEWEITRQPKGAIDDVRLPDVNEGPQFLSHHGEDSLIISSNGSWSNEYCLARIKYLGGPVLEPPSWEKDPTPVFQSSEHVKGVGHASFVTDESGADTIIFHAARYPCSGWDRQVRYKPFIWNEDGSPNFGSP